MARSTPQEARDKWATRLSGATAEIKAGIMRVTVAPGQQAAAKVDKYRQNVLDAVPKWQRNVGAVSLQQWQQAASTIGVDRVAAGAQAKKGKYEAFATKFWSHLDQLEQKMAAMPDTTFEQRLARMVEAARHNHSFKNVQ